MIRARLAAVACVWLVVSAAPHAARPAQTAASIFRFDADNFWLNLNQFLYVLGRDAAEQPDRLRRAVAQAPKEQADALVLMTKEEHTRWKTAVSIFPSRLDAVFDKTLVDVETALTAVKPDAVTLDGVSLPTDVKFALQIAAPVYRVRFWPAHRAANAKWVATMQPLLDQHGAKILAFIAAKYGLPWPADGYPVRVVAYANWAGAFSTGDKILIMSSLDAGNAGTSALETVFHESMHQWDDAIEAAIAAAARAQGKLAPANLSHAMIFYTAGEAVRRIVPGHVPYGEANGLWARMGGLKTLLDTAWLPYLNGTGTRDEAMAALIRAANLSNPFPRTP